MEEANAAAEPIAHILPEMILVTHLDKPLPRAPKSTIIRPQALELYAEEIDELCVTLLFFSRCCGMW